MITPAELDEMERWARAAWPSDPASGKILALIAEVRRLRAMVEFASRDDRPHG